MFKIKTSNAMALNLDFPLIIVRYPYTYRKDSNAQYVNQFAVKMLTDVQSGIAPVEWQSYEGPVLAYRPQIEYEDAKHFNRFDFEVISKPDYFGFQNKSTSQAWKVENICKEFKLQPEKQNILWEEFWMKDKIFYYLISQRFLRL